MLSILIPVYNYKVTDLVSTLFKQADKLDYEVEIFCYDDGSRQDYLDANKRIGQLPYVQYHELPSNLGRAAIRNRLASIARYERLLFLDCDSGIIKEDFLSTYLTHVDTPIVIGGRVYSQAKPSNAGQLLHWKYGSIKESRSLLERQANPHIYFHSNNFMISKDLFLDLLFDETIEGYGYEDLFFAQALKVKNIKISHIDNPVLHLHIESNKDFLIKTKNAVKNLRQLNNNGVFMDSKLELAAQKVQRFGLSGLYKSFYKLRRNKILANLNSINPNLRFLDYYKLYNYLS